MSALRSVPMPSERQWVTIGIFFLIVFLLLMARDNPDLWKIDPFKTVLQAVVITGMLNMILAFHFTANKSDEAKTENTGKMAEAIRAVATAASGTDNNAIHAGDQVTVEKPS